MIMATTREKCIAKFRTLLTFCDDSGMAINQRKTKLMVVNGASEDKAPISVGNISVEYSSHYVYLGAHFTDDGRISTVINLHAKDCVKHVNKFGMFVRRNTGMPYSLKVKVLNAALMSSMLYGCEAWLTKNVAQVAKHYTTALKLLLGVRSSTTNVLCMVESGRPELSSIILKKRCTFINTFSKNASGDEPLVHALTICRNANTKMYRMLMHAKNYIGDPEIHNLEKLRSHCLARSSNSTKINTYLEMNPYLSTPSIYTSPANTVPDYLRVSYTRFRLSAHRLQVETGRWTRTPRHLRVCTCDHVSLQDERHTLFHCKITAQIRTDYDMLDYDNNWMKFFNAENHLTLCTVIHKLLNVYA